MAGDDDDERHDRNCRGSGNADGAYEPPHPSIWGSERHADHYRRKRDVRCTARIRRCALRNPTASQTRAASRGIGRSKGSRPIFDCNSARSVKMSAWRRNSSAIIGGWLDIVEITVTRTPRRWTASTR